MIQSATGPMYYKGVYHLFYQYNPYAAVWGNISWAHSISYDLVNWIHLDNALSPDDPFDINGCWSGSTTVLPDGKPVILYTGSDTMNRQVQNLAEPKNVSDPLLREWVKSAHNPLMTPVDGIDPKSFRDPTTAWLGPDGLWRVLDSRSKEPLHSSTRTGMWECPDFYPVSIDGKDGVDTSSLDKSTKHVLKVSFNDCDHYVLGNYMPVTDNFSVDSDFLENGSDLRYDYGKFYASKTFFDSGKKRRILWGWIPESDSTTDDIEKGWSGLQWKRSRCSVPKMSASRTRNLRVDLYLEVSGITASQADVEVSFDLSNLKEAELMDPSWIDPQLLCSQKTASVRGNVGPFGILAFASNDLTEQTAIFLRVLVIRADRCIRIPELQIDHSIVESFGGEGRACITARVYPKLAIDNQAYLYAFNNGTFDVNISTLNAWSMKKAQIVSSTKRRKPHLN
ncbi:hypothetical protein V6N12_067237 [Hibiscus sabdariffa]|uniref:Uncharacterized protein n=1 Tax=Hibiscus sabdariffa TaxID=183260 RepID=A0ABR2BDR0_9ROSI